MKKELIGIIICVLLLGSVLPVSGNVIVDKSPLSSTNGNILYVGGSGEGNYTKIQDAIYYPRGFKFRKTEENTQISFDEELSGITESFRDNNYPSNNKFLITGVPNIIYVPDDYPTIQLAVNHAIAGDVIIVRNGTYTENILVEKPLTIRSEYGYDNCIIQPNNPDEYTLSIINTSVDIIGFQISNLDDTGYIGIFLNHAYNCNISYNRIHNNIFEIKVQNSDNNMFYGNILGRLWFGDVDFYGIQLKNSNNNSIIKNTIFDLIRIGFGVHLINSDDNIIEYNYLYDTNYAIIIEESSNYNTISNNRLDSNHHGGIFIWGSGHNTITNNVINNTYWDGIYFHLSNYTIIKNNTLTNDGIFVFDSYNNVVEENIVNDKPLVYYEDEADKVIKEQTGEIILINCKNIIIKYQDISHVEDGIEMWMTCNTTISECNIFSNHFEAIWLAYSDNNTITDCNLSDSWSGIALHYSDKNEIVSNVFYDNRWEGIKTDDSDLNEIHYNTFIVDESYGIFLENSNHNNISYNTIFYPIPSNYGFSGIYLKYSELNRIEHNYVHNNLRGIDLAVSNNNSILYNDFSDNEIDINLDISYYNKIKCNNIKDTVCFWYYFFDFSFYNNWNNNYWGKAKNIKIIFGMLSFTPFGAWAIVWINFDWNPAQEPYDIGI